VLAAVEFDDQAALYADKIDNIAKRFVLATKLEAQLRAT
jgi:hypothetical protein